jgi:hypothetical protein
VGRLGSDPPEGTLASGQRTTGMRHRLAIFSVPFAFVLGVEYLLQQDAFPKSCIALISVPWSRLLTAAILAGGITWLWFRLRSTP